MSYYLLFLFSLVIEAIVTYQYTSSIFTAKFSNKLRLYHLIVLYIFIFLFACFHNVSLNIIVFFLVNILFILISFETNIWQACFHSAVFSVMMATSEFIFLGIFLRHFPNFIEEAGKWLVLYTILSKIFFFIITLLIAYALKSNTEISSDSNIVNFLYLFIPISYILVMLSFASIIREFTLSVESNVLIVTSSIFLLVTNLGIFGLNYYNGKKNKEFLEMQLLLQKEFDAVQYYKMLLSQNENQQILIHDIKKHLQSIQLLNKENGLEKVDDYINELMNSSDLRESVKLCDNEMLNAILYRYQRKCRENGVSFQVDIRSGLVHNILEYDLTSIFCNLLDNALEATGHIPGAFIELTVSKKNATSFIMIILVNSCDYNPKYNQSGLPISRKRDSKRHGLGMKSVQKIVSKYNGNLNLYYNEKKATFHTIITLKIK